MPLKSAKITIQNAESQLSVHVLILSLPDHHKCPFQSLISTILTRGGTNYGLTLR